MPGGLGVIRRGYAEGRLELGDDERTTWVDQPVQCVGRRAGCGV
jgi:hypothetical protein